MPRIACIIVLGQPNHVTHRGNNRQTVFFVDDDRRLYLDTLREQCDRFNGAIDGYCLRANHVRSALIIRDLKANPSRQVMTTTRQAETR